MWESAPVATVLNVLDLLKFNVQRHNIFLVVMSCVSGVLRFFKEKEENTTDYDRIVSFRHAMFNNRKILPHYVRTSHASVIMHISIR